MIPTAPGASRLGADGMRVQPQRWSSGGPLRAPALTVVNLILATVTLWFLIAQGWVAPLTS